VEDVPGPEGLKKYFAPDQLEPKFGGTWKLK